MLCIGQRPEPLETVKGEADAIEIEHPEESFN